MTDTTIAVVGALGMTGRAIAARLAEREAPTVLIGRRKDALAELACSLPGAQARPVDVTHQHDLIEALACVGVAVSCVGPYSELGWRVAQAALVAGTHYADVSGEPEWVLRLLNEIDASARSQSLIFVPACGAAAVLGDVAARLAVADATGPVRSVDISGSFAPRVARRCRSRPAGLRPIGHFPVARWRRRLGLPAGARSAGDATCCQSGECSTSPSHGPASPRLRLPQTGVRRRPQRGADRRCNRHNPHRSGGVPVDRAGPLLHHLGGGGRGRTAPDRRRRLAGRPDGAHPGARRPRC